MRHLRVLLIEGEHQSSERIACALSEANHTVLPAGGLEEASEALSVEKFDAVILASPVPGDSLAAFAAKLRAFEKGHRGSAHIPILSVSPQVSDSHRWSAADDKDLDGYLAEPFEPDALTEAVLNLASAVKASSSEDIVSDLAIFEPEEFKEQVGYDNELVVEIISLYLSERQRQSVEMREALEAGNFALLSRIAHTIKGSLGSLHAGIAKSCAQDLELAAKQGDAQSCPTLLVALERALDVLEPYLVALRDSTSSI